MLYVLIVVAVGMLMGLVKVRVQVEHHKLAACILALQIIIRRQLLEASLALLQLLVSLRLRIFIFGISTMVRRLERYHVRGVELNSAQRRGVLAAEQLRL